VFLGTAAVTCVGLAAGLSVQVVEALAAVDRQA